MHGGIKEKGPILLIDDNVEIIKLLSALLSDEAELIFATDGNRGLALARERKPDLILLDIDMPGLDGYDVCRQLKGNPETANISVIFVTAYSSEEAEIQGIEAGAVDYITKPINSRLARARINAHLTAKLHTDLLRQIASRDGLTNLYNRRFFNEQLEVEWRRHLRYQQPLSLVLLDIDHFKLYNDHYGHLEGDACLIKVARTITESTSRAGEIVARFGGEEIAVILPNTGAEGAFRYAGHICNSFNKLQIPHEHSPTAGHVTVSIGVSSNETANILNIQGLIKSADNALYLAKSRGRNQAAIESM